MHTHSTWWLCCPVCSDWRLAVSCSGRCDLGKKKTHLILFQLSCAPITVFICLWADFNSAQQQVSVCVRVRDAATRAEQRAILSALQSISHTHAHIHHTLDGGAHHNVTFNLDEPTVCSGDIMDWMMAGKWMMRLRSPATSIHISDPLTLQVPSFSPQTSLSFTIACI